MVSLASKERILDVAERLFAERGFAATSLRNITAEAAVNLAAVHYHFGSKDELIEAVFARRLGPLNRERLRLLEACQAAVGGASPSVEELLEALIAPALRSGLDSRRGGQFFMRLLGRTYAEPGEAALGILREQFEQTVRRFSEALGRALPELPPAEVLWRVHFAIGSMAHTMVGAHKLQALSNGLCDPADVEAIVERLVAFLSAGMRADLRPRARAGREFLEEGSRT